MALTHEPLSPWHVVVTILVSGAIMLLLARWAFDRWQTFGRRLKVRLSVLLLSLGAALLFAYAAWNPSRQHTPDSMRFHLAVAVDVSDSVLRTEDDWPRVRRQTHELIASGIVATSDQIRTQSNASIVTFGSSVVVVEPEMPLAELPSAFERLRRNDFAAGDESDVEAGLLLAGELVGRGGGRGAVLLISDGHQTTGDALAAAQRLAQRGIAVHVHPVASREPELSITAADLPRQVSAETGTFMRGVLWNGSSEAVAAVLTLSKNPVLKSLKSSDMAVTWETAATIPPGTWARFRHPIAFRGPGLQFAQLSLTPTEGEGQHRRRFFTHVNERQRILAIGGDNNWTGALSSAVFSVTQVHPSDVNVKFDLLDFDAIAISSVPASRFSDDALNAIVEAVDQDGVGLIVINGAHRGASPETQTVLQSYDDTVLAPLLPVISEPLVGSIAHQIVIMMDASDSMSSWQIEKAKQIARHIVEELLQPQDRLDLIIFTAGAYHLVEDREMDDDGKRDAIEHINRIGASGGTDPSAALALIARRKMTNCSLVFISDGYFARVAERPDCRATVFAIGHEFVPKDSPLWELADPFPVGIQFDPSDVQIPDMEPPQNFFEPGSYVPVPVKGFVGVGDYLPVPKLLLQGTAVTYIKQDAELAAVRLKLAHPVLAYHESEAGYVGAVTTAFPDAWLNEEQGRQAIEAWVAQVIPYTARDRYNFKLKDLGDAIEIHISLVARDEKLPDVNYLTANIEIGGEVRANVPLRDDPTAPATFSGYIRIPRGDRVQKATLVLRESGPDALLRPQRVPIFIPPAETVETLPSGEAYSYGLNRPLLQAIAQSGGGVWDPAAGRPLLRGGSVKNQGKPLWPFLLIAAVILYFAATALRRLEL
jgi:Mg-chelatase subunit ChlD